MSQSTDQTVEFLRRGVFKPNEQNQRAAEIMRAKLQAGEPVMLSAWWDDLWNGFISVPINTFNAIGGTVQSAGNAAQQIAGNPATWQAVAGAYGLPLGYTYNQQGQVVPVQNGLNLSNPIVLVGAGLLLYAVLKK